MAHDTAGRRRFDTVVVENVPLCREHFRLRLHIHGHAFAPTRPGQFIQLGCRTPNGAMDDAALQGGAYDWQPGRPVTLRQPELCAPMALLRRPFSLAGRGDDADGTWLDVIHRVIGVGTEWLAHRKPGDAVDLIGPLGNSFALPAGKSIGLLVGGGVGLPPMFYLAEALRDAGWRGVGFVGALTRDLLAVSFAPGATPAADGLPGASVAEFTRCGFDSVVTTDDGSLGLRGRITDGLVRYLDAQSPDDAAKTVVFTCGPEPMMHAVAQLAEARGIACEVCLEQAMACGMGTCQSCVVKIESPHDPHGQTAAGRPWRYRLACTDGPVFDSTQVVW